MQWVFVTGVAKASGRRQSNGSQKSEPTSGADAVGNAMAAGVLVGEQVDPRRDMESNASRWSLHEK